MPENALAGETAARREAEGKNPSPKGSCFADWLLYVSTSTRPSAGELKTNDLAAARCYLDSCLRGPSRLGIQLSLHAA